MNKLFVSGCLPGHACKSADLRCFLLNVPVPQKV